MPEMSKTLCRRAVILPQAIAGLVAAATAITVPAACGSGSS